MAETYFEIPSLPAFAALGLLADLVARIGETDVRRFSVSCQTNGRATIRFHPDGANSFHAQSGSIWQLMGELYRKQSFVANSRARHLECPELRDLRLSGEGGFLRDLSALVACAIVTAKVRGPGIEAEVLPFAAPDRDCAYIIGSLEDPGRLAQAFARIEWRSSGMTLSCTLGSGSQGQGRETAQNIAIARIGMDADWGATQDIALAYQDAFECNVDLRRTYILADGFMLLKTNVKLEAGIRDAVSTILSAYLGRDRRLGPFLFGIDWSEDEDGISRVEAFLGELPELDVTPAVAPQEGGIEITHTRLVHSDEATRHLRELMSQHAGEIGNRLSLKRVPFYADSEEDLLEIDQQIDELAIRRDLLLGEGAGDWRLLRFPAHGLKALVDYLRRFRVDIADSGHIRYAFRASDLEPSGVHYLLYRLRDIGSEPSYPASIWRDAMKCGTVEHRIDPIFAQFAVARRARSLVFAPHNHMLVPTFRATQSDVDAYLRQGLGGFYSADEAFKVPPGQKSQPIYLFGFTQEAKIRLEIMDVAQFQPIQRVVPFLNDNLEIGHHIAVEDFISQMADAHWRTDRLEQLEVSSRDLSEQLDARIGALDRQMAEQGEQLLAAMTQEVDALRTYLSKITGLMEDLSERSVALERLVSESVEKAASHDEMVGELPRNLVELESTRRAIQHAIWNEHQNAEAFTQTASRNMRAIRDKIARLREELTPNAEE